MKKITQIISGATLLIISLVGTPASSATFTAVTSGAWSSAATWGGTAPSFNLALDQVTIPSGITVTMDNNVTLNGATGKITVQGTLSALTGNSFMVISGIVDGTGSMNVDTASFNTTAVLSFTGSLTANVFNNSATSLQSASSVIVNKTLNLTSGVLSLQTGGSLTMSNNSTIVKAAGQLTLSGGTLGLSANYNVNYTTASSTTGLELSGSGLKNVTVNVPSGNSVTLASALTINGTLYLTSGTLNFNSTSLTLNGDMSGSGSLSGNSTSNLIINTTGGPSGSLNFASGGQSIHDFTLNVGSGTLALASNLTVAGTLNLTGGSKLNISGVTLTLGGNLSGSGSLVANSSSGLIVNATGVLSSAISFSGNGNSIGTLVINTGTGNNAVLGSSLTVAGTLTLQTGTLLLNSYNLTISGNISASGSGMISSTASSDISLNAGSSPSGALTFTSTGNKVHNFTVNVGGSGGNIMIGSNLEIDGTLSFTNGSINIGGNILSIGASGSITGAGNNSYIITNANGYLSQSVNAGGTLSTSYPIGTSTRYFPAAVLLSSASSSGTIQVGVMGGVQSQGTSGTNLATAQSLVDATWMVQSNITSGLDMTMELTWPTAAEVNSFNHSNAYISHYTNSRWDAIATASATAKGGGMFSMQRSGITSLSPFAVFDNNTKTGIAERGKNSPFELYPNPAKDLVMVKNISSTDEIIFLDIMNVMGEVIARHQLHGNSDYEISLNKLNEGSYFIRLYNDHINVVQKLSKM